jgi:hypothetical protein
VGGVGNMSINRELYCGIRYGKVVEYTSPIMNAFYSDRFSISQICVWIRNFDYPKCSITRSRIRCFSLHGMFKQSANLCLTSLYHCLSESMSKPRSIV